jgi:hypothetical protein
MEFVEWIEIESLHAIRRIEDPSHDSTPTSEHHFADTSRRELGNALSRLDEGDHFH